MQSGTERSAMDGEVKKTASGKPSRAFMRAQTLEAIWPYFAGAGLASGVVFLAARNGIPPEIKEVFEYTASTAGVFAGFMLAAASILATIGDRPFIRQAQRAGVYSALVKALFTAMRWCVSTALISIPGILFNPAWHLRWYPVAIWVWSFCAFTAMGTTALALGVFTRLMSYVSEY